MGGGVWEIGNHWSVCVCACMCMFCSAIFFFILVFNILSYDMIWLRSRDVAASTSQLYSQGHVVCPDPGWSDSSNIPLEICTWSYFYFLCCLKFHSIPLWRFFQHADGGGPRSTLNPHSNNCILEPCVCQIQGHDHWEERREEFNLWSVFGCGSRSVFGADFSVVSSKPPWFYVRSL